MSILKSRTLWILALAVIALCGAAAFDGAVGATASGLLVLTGIGIALWLLSRGLRWFLFRVGRRLAFSYFLIGVLPIPMALGLTILTLTLLAGFYIGDLYRTGVTSVYEDLERSADLRLDELRRGRRGPEAEGATMYAYYKRGVRVAGDARLPRRWPEWLDGRKHTTEEGHPSFVALEDGTPTVVASATEGGFGVLSVFSGSINTRLTEESGVWTVLLRADDPDKQEVIQVNVFGRTISLRPFGSKEQMAKERLAYFEQAESSRFWHRPGLLWVELSGPLMALDDGRELTPYVAAELNATPASLYGRLISGSTELSTVAIGMFIGIASLLAAIYAIAVAMALFMIYALSRAVNSLTTATEAVRDGDFGFRIPVRRTDQLGELQHSFNEMSSNLEQLVATAAEAEILEKELSIARDVQQSLLPQDLPSSDAIEFATLFKPSAAIGGDYFDVLSRSAEELMVVVADVSGHGLPTGLRMAMLKSALGILIDDGKEPREVFTQLHDVVRADAAGNRYFVTATICRIDLEHGRAQITNAGHPPTYLVRDGSAREIVLHGTPLGTLGTDYGQESVDLEPNDFLVWLSDGLIERVDRRGEPFGYTRLLQTLSTRARSARELRDVLVSTIESYAGGIPAEDDCTLVVLRYSPPTAEAASSGSSPSLE